MNPTSSTTQTSLAARDRIVSWHPYTQHATEAEPLAVRSAQGAELGLEDGRRVLDAISSWWAILHGHGEPKILEAMARQAQQLDHVLFAGATHEPAVRLAERLIEVAPPGLSRVFYSDNGSTAVEVALKMVLQSHRLRGQPQRCVFVALEGSYHGDTFGAMSIGDPDPFFLPFAPLLFESVRIPAQADAIGKALDQLGDRAAGLIMEPLVQGAAGMQMHSADFVREARNATTERGLPLIADEVMTGFGRTGSLFACEQAEISPDVLCLAKGLTGGITPLSATLAREEMFEDFLADDRARAFFHGHTFTAHPIGCAAGLASLDLCQENDTPALFEALGRRIQTALEADLSGNPRVREIRRTGGIAAVEMEPPSGQNAGYLAGQAPKWRAAALKHNCLLRPLGNVLYALPPACTSEAQADRIAEVMVLLINDMEL